MCGNTISLQLTVLRGKSLDLMVRQWFKRKEDCVEQEREQLGFEVGGVSTKLVYPSIER